MSGSRPKGETEGRGLPSIEQARRERSRVAPRLWTWLLLVCLALVVAYWKLESGKLDDLRAALLSRQREVAQRFRNSWFSLRERIERYCSECGADALPEVAPGGLVASWDFTVMPGIYLRIAKKNASDALAIRAAANKSLHDGFTACLFRLDNPSPLAGEPCESTQDCPPARICNEFRLCAEYSQPYNLRTAYRALHVLSDEWVHDIQSERNELALRGASQSFDGIEKYDLPVATDLLANAKYFLVVVDEPPAGADPEPPPASSETPALADDRSISSLPHPARVCLWRLQDGKKMLSIRRDAAGELIGGGTPTDAQTRSARQRQVNSCALAQEIRQVIGAR